MKEHLFSWIDLDEISSQPMAWNYKWIEINLRLHAYVRYRKGMSRRWMAWKSHLWRRWRMSWRSEVAGDGNGALTSTLMSRFGKWTSPTPNNITGLLFKWKRKSKKTLA